LDEVNPWNRTDFIRVGEKKNSRGQGPPDYRVQLNRVTVMQGSLRSLRILRELCGQSS
jgi:hypothetical protein